MKLVALSALFSTLAFGLASCEPDRGQARPEATNMKKEATDAKKIPEGAETITLGGGCFWCVEAVYQQLEGVHSVVSGYMGGFVPNPTYEQVCEKTTGHVEVVQLAFDPKKISSEDILAWFWDLHDPTTLNRQGADEGPQYASVVFFHSDEQKKAAEKSMKEAKALFKSPIVTRIEKAKEFYKAEDIHQNFYFLNGQKNRYCQLVIEPKLKKLKLKTGDK
jgi:peptide-methionine (S)-S-oxide reductase